MKTTPMSVSALPRPPPRCTAATSTPMAIANTAGSTPRRTSTTHHAVARKRSAFGRTPKKIHSLRAVSCRITVRVSPQTLDGCAFQECESYRDRGIIVYRIKARSTTESLERLLLVAAPRVILGEFHAKNRADCDGPDPSSDLACRPGPRAGANLGRAGRRYGGRCRRGADGSVYVTGTTLS